MNKFTKYLKATFAISFLAAALMSWGANALGLNIFSMLFATIAAITYFSFIVIFLKEELTL